MKLKFWKVKFKEPDKIEKRILAAMVIFGVLWWISSNLFLQQGTSWQPHLISSILLPGVTVFWVSLIAYHILMMTIIVRSILKRGGTDNKYDYIVGFTMIIGVFCVITSVLYGVYNGKPLIEFFYDVPYMTLFAIGFLIEALGTTWFAFTE